jgi:hypothetical protein
MSDKCGTERSIKNILQPIGNDLIELQNLYSKTIIYAKLKWCGYGYAFLRTILHRAEKKSGQMINRDLVSQYHASCTDQV